MAPDTVEPVPMVAVEPRVTPVAVPVAPPCDDVAPVGGVAPLGGVDPSSWVTPVNGVAPGGCVDTGWNDAPSGEVTPGGGVVTQAGGVRGLCGGVAPVGGVLASMMTLFGVDPPDCPASGGTTGRFPGPGAGVGGGSGTEGGDPGLGLVPAKTQKRLNMRSSMRT